MCLVSIKTGHKGREGDGGGEQRCCLCFNHLQYLVFSNLLLTSDNATFQSSALGHKTQWKAFRDALNTHFLKVEKFPLCEVIKVEIAKPWLLETSFSTSFCSIRQCKGHRSPSLRWGSCTSASKIDNKHLVSVSLSQVNRAFRETQEGLRSVVH